MNEFSRNFLLALATEDEVALKECLLKASVSELTQLHLSLSQSADSIYKLLVTTAHMRNL